MTKTHARTARIVATLVAVAAAALTSLTPASAAPALDDIVVHVNHTTGLDDGSVVHAIAHHLPPDTTFDVSVCDSLRTDNGFGSGCDVLTTVTSNAAGRAATTVRLPAYQLNFDQYEGHPVYCRTDVCHLFFSITDEDGNQHGASSTALDFVGSLATVHASPSTNLPKVKRVHVTGTAFGAEGRTVLVRQTACIDRPSGGYECAPSNRRYVATTVDSTGHYATTYVARRFDGSYDCRDGEYYACGIAAEVLNRDGSPDDSFGNQAAFGDPTTYLEFR